MAHNVRYGDDNHEMPVKHSSNRPWNLTRISVRALIVFVLLLGGGFGWSVSIYRRGAFSARLSRPLTLREALSFTTGKRDQTLCP